MQKLREIGLLVHSSMRCPQHGQCISATDTITVTLWQPNPDNFKACSCDQGLQLPFAACHSVLKWKLAVQS